MRNAQNPTKPSLDTVLVWVTFTIERDFIARGVFPVIRRALAVEEGSSSFLLHMTARSVQPILNDARARREQTTKGLRHAYAAFVRSLEAAIEEAAGRQAIFNATEAVCTYKSEYYEHWRGTKEQLRAAGISLDGPWPGEEGGRAKWAMGSSKGRSAYISAYSRIWPGLFKVRIEIPSSQRARSADADERAKRRARAESDLNAMPRDAEEYRMHLIEGVRRLISAPIQSKPVDWHGFTLSEDAVESILMSCDAVVQAILDAEVIFDRQRHRKIELAYQQQIAEADESFQHVLGELTTVRPEILQGSAS